MDSVTHVALGAAVAGLVAGRSCSRQVLLWGAILGTLPDFDVLIDWGDAVSNVVQHRSFTHSLFVLLPFSWILAYLVNYFVRPLQFSFYSLWALIAGCLMTHPLLDAFTSYGTQLFWPLRRQPVALSSVFIIDPFYSLPLLVGAGLLLLLPLRPMTLYFNGLGLLISTVYLFFSFMLQAYVLERVNDTLEHRDMAAVKIFVSPMPFSIALWRIIVLNDDTYYEGMVSIMDDANEPVDLYPFSRVSARRNYAVLDMYQYLKWFTGDFITVREYENRLLITDLRLGIHGINPFKFVVAERIGEQWSPLVTYRLPEEQLRTDLVRILKRMWRRLIGHDLDLCEVSTGVRCI